MTRGGDTFGTASVDFATANGTATAGSDYTAASGTISFASGETSKTISVSVHGDTEIEPDEHFLVNLSNPVDATVSDGQAVGMVLDDDGDVTIGFPDFSDSSGLNLIGDAAIANGNTLRLTPAAGGREGAAWYTAEKQFAGVDWETKFDFNLNENFGDVGGSDGFAFIIQNYDSAYLAGGGGTLGYLDLPNSIAVEFDTFQNSEVSDPSSSHISVHTNGTGPNSWDESLSLGSFSTPSIMDDASMHTARIRYYPGTLSVFLDDLITPVLEVPVDLEATLGLDAGKAWVGFTSATGGGYQNHDILNWTYKVFADTGTTVSIDDVAHIEGDSGTSNMVFTVTRDGDTAGTTTVDWSTSDGTATEVSDYSVASGQVSFAAGETQKTISIAIQGDTIEEDVETLFVKLANVTGGIVIDGTGTGSIVNDDTSLLIADATATEGDSSLKPLGRFVADGSGGLARPRLSTFGPDANLDGAQDLYVGSADTNEILLYDGLTGAFIAPFVTGESALDNPVALEFSPTDGHLYVSSALTDEVLRFDGTTGTYIDTPVSGLADPFGLAFFNDGKLLIANRGTNEVLLYDGSSVRVFVSAGSGGLDGPRRPAFGPDGDLYLTSANTSEILRYDGQTGAFKNVFATVPFANITWLEFAPGGVAYATGLTTAEYSDRSVARIDSTAGTVIDTLSLGRDGWGFTVGPDELIYVSGHGFGDHIDRIGPSSISAFTVSLSKPSGVPVTADFSTSDGTATANSGDYAATSGSITFPAGVTTRTILVSTLDDNAEEPDETFQVTLSNASGATIADSQGIATIADDDGVQNDPNTLYVYDIGFESRKGGRDWRAVFQIHSDSNADGQGDSADARATGVAITVTFAGRTYSGTTDSNGQFRSGWIRGLSKSDHYANAVDLALTGFTWNQLDLDLEDDSDGDGNPDNVLSL